MTLFLIGEKPAVIWRCRTFVLHPVRPDTRTPYSWMSGEVCKSLERKLCLQAYRQVNTQKFLRSWLPLSHAFSTRTPVRPFGRSPVRPIGKITEVCNLPYSYCYSSSFTINTATVQQFPIDIHLLISYF
jgi:hypothetical protein